MKRKLHSKQMDEDQKKMDGLRADGLISEFDITRATRRGKEKLLTYEWEGFISSLRTTNKSMDAILAKVVPLTNESASQMASIIGCPLEFVKKLVAGEHVVNEEPEVAEKIEVNSEPVDTQEDKEPSDEELKEVEANAQNVDPEEVADKQKSEEAAPVAGAAPEAGPVPATTGEPGAPASEPVVKKRKGGRKPGSKNKPKDVAAVNKPAAAKGEADAPGATPSVKVAEPTAPAAASETVAPTEEPSQPSLRSKEQFAKRFGPNSSAQPVSKKHALMNISTALGYIANGYTMLKDAFEELAIVDGE